MFYKISQITQLSLVLVAIGFLAINPFFSLGLYIILGFVQLVTGLIYVYSRTSGNESMRRFKTYLLLATIALLSISLSYFTKVTSFAALGIFSSLPLALWFAFLNKDAIREMKRTTY